MNPDHGTGSALRAPHPDEPVNEGSVTGESVLMVPARELPALAFAYLAFLFWVYCLPQPLKFGAFGMWLLPWAGLWAYHPLHEGWCSQEMREAA